MDMKTPGFIDPQILDRVIETWGIPAQCEMIIEECLELALAIQKLKRRRGNHNEKLANLYDEIADVTIMINQAHRIFSRDKINERIDFKMNRLEERLNEKIKVP